MEEDSLLNSLIRVIFYQIDFFKETTSSSFIFCKLHKSQRNLTKTRLFCSPVFAYNDNVALFFFFVTDSSFGIIRSLFLHETQSRSMICYSRQLLWCPVRCEGDFISSDFQVFESSRPTATSNIEGLMKWLMHGGQISIACTI